MQAAVEHISQAGSASVLTHWPLYATLVTGGAAVALSANAFEVSPLTASEPGIVATNPLLSVVLGVALFGSDLTTTPYHLVGALAGLGSWARGIFVIARSPTVTGEEQGAVADGEATPN